MLIPTRNVTTVELRGDNCALLGHDNDRRHLEKRVLPHVGTLRFFKPKNKQGVLSWSITINRVSIQGYNEY